MQLVQTWQGLSGLPPRRECLSPCLIKHEGYHHEKGFITVATDIKFDNERIGTLMIKSDLTPLESIQKRSSSATLISLLVGFVLVFLNIPFLDYHRTLFP